MSRQNVEVVSRALEEFIATRRFSDEFAADVTWDLSTFRGWPDRAVFHGLEGFTEFLSAWIEPYDEWSMDLEQILDPGGNQVVAVLVQRGQLRGSDSVVGLRYGVVYTVEDGQVRGAQVYTTPEEALEAVGLSE
jgi:ketosteroid isomerase-like protein